MKIDLDTLAEKCKEAIELIQQLTGKMEPEHLDQFPDVAVELDIIRHQLNRLFVKNNEEKDLTTRISLIN
jgi:hypothetical protein